MKPEQLLTVEPKVLAERANALELLGSEEEVERLLEASNVSAEDHALPQHLRDAEDLVDVRVPQAPIRSHRPVLGPLIVSSKRLFRAAFQPFINELLRTQVAFNERIVGALSLLHEQIERQAAQDRKWRTEVEKRLDALEHEREREGKDTE